MEFNKYKYYGAYHWQLYITNGVYSQYVDYIKSWVRKGTTLDIGAGDGLITRILKADGIENDKYALEIAEVMKVNVVYGDAYNLPKENKYDNVLLANVIEHLEHYKKALNQIKQVLNPDGLLYVTTCPAVGEELQDKYHYFEWTPQEFKDNMFRCGFKCISLDVREDISEMFGVFKL